MISLCKHDIAYLSFEDLKYFNFRLVFQIFLLTYLSTDFVETLLLQLYISSFHHLTKESVGLLNQSNVIKISFKRVDYSPLEELGNLVSIKVIR